MTRAWSFAPCWLAIWLAWSAVHAASPVPGSLSVDGELVDPDVPTTYRLPLVSPPAAPVAEVTTGNPLPLFTPPSEDRLAQRTSIPPATDTQTKPATTPAGSPPDDRLVDEPADDQQVKRSSPPSTSLTPDTVAYTPTTTELTAQLLPAVQRGYRLAQKGALFAARTEFVQVLRRVAQAQDAAASTDEHSRALAAGLRALDEADDFVPDGVQLEAELDVRVAASSHRTQVLPDEPQKVLAFEAVALYHSFAQEQLAQAAAGEQAGSMALYGLGKVYARLAERKDDDVQFTRGAMTMYSAALGACPENHLAANELGVLLCRTGRPAEAARLFERTIDRAPRATAYHNLAVAQRKLGLHGQAEANEREAHRLAAWERATGELSRRAGVQWVSPAELAGVTQPAQLTPAATHAAPPPPPPKSPWQRTVELTKSLPGRRSESTNDRLGPMPTDRLAHPMISPAASQWR